MTVFAAAPGFAARVEREWAPNHDAHDRTSLCVSGATINKGVEQPVHFAPGEELLLTDSVGTALLIRIPEVLAKAAVLEYEAQATGPMRTVAQHEDTGHECK